ncbi:MAG: multidrug transporter MatE [Oscillospiraceae bacterium]|nr:multidrug transporter MatE [Oscillospiraceae bacterium]MBQ6699425.1 multidrug transporter MatE [Oscillospiraceae bacterium]
MENKRGFYKNFFYYVIPAVLSFALSGVCSIVDGFFVGNAVGDIGLSAINVAVPIVMVMQCLGTGIGMGGSVWYSINNASQKADEAKKYLACTLWLLIISSLVLTTVCLLFTEELISLLGAEGRILEYGIPYIKVMAFGAIFQVFATGVVPIIRNNGGSAFATITMVSGFATNILLDWVFVWVIPWETFGAALASVIAQALTMFLGLGYIIAKKLFILKFPKNETAKLCKNIAKIGISPFGIAMLPHIFLIFVNWFSIEYGGERAVAVYACIAYIIYMAYVMVQGVGDGSQPIMSTYYGEGDKNLLKKTRDSAYVTSLAVGAFCMVIFYIGRFSFGNFFGASPEVVFDMGKVFPIFLAAVPFVAISRVTVSYFYATEKSSFAYILTYAEPIFLFLLLLIIPRFFGQMGVWWSIAGAQTLTAALSAIFVITKKTA